MQTLNPVSNQKWQSASDHDVLRRCLAYNNNNTARTNYGELQPSFCKIASILFRNLAKHVAVSDTSILRLPCPPS